MFTGLVEDVGRLESRSSRGLGARLSISTKLDPLVLGESIAVMGVCLTVDGMTKGGFQADASAETLARTSLGQLPVGHQIHLERALAVGGRLGGHIVSGHVDGLGQLVERNPLGQAVRLCFMFPGPLAPLIATKGSIAIDGVSLTVNEIRGDRFDVVIVPHTQEATLLGDMSPGDRCNLEVDVLARYVVRWLETSKGEDAGADRGDESLMARLRSSGFL